MILGLLFSQLFCISSSAQPPTIMVENQKIQLEELGKISDAVWGLIVLPDGSYLFTAREGKLYTLNPESKELKAFSGAPKVHASGQGGLLDIALDPNFKTNFFVYLTYSTKNNDGKSTTALGRGKWTESGLVDFQNIFTAEAWGKGGNHFGSRLAFDRSGHLFMTVGERDEREKAQDPKVHNGKVLRLSFAAEGKVTAETWSMGHRNPQGIVFDEKSNRIYEVEHGPRGGDELNLIEQNKNYGWPVITFGKEYWGLKTSIGEGTKKDGMEQPLTYWVPSISPSDLLLYSGKMFKAWKNDFLVTALSGQLIAHLKMDGSRVLKENRYLNDLGERFRSITEDSEGRLILTTDSGRVRRLSLEK